MEKLPEIIKQGWADKEGPIIFATVDCDGKPNIIYATCVSLFNDETIVVANNYFSKTLHNIQNGSKGSILFMSKMGKSFQIKGQINYYEEGPVFDDMKEWNPEKHPGHGAAAIAIEEIYSGEEKIL